MKILKIKSLAIPDVKVIRFARFADERGYFTETYRFSDMHHPSIGFLRDVVFLQQNESRSVTGVVRGLHFQWNPPMGKLIRTVRGRMIDLVMDIRKNSPTRGKIIAYDMPDDPKTPYGEWIWVPGGFAHGNFFTAETTIEYFCNAEYKPDCESGICPLSPDIDWSLCDPVLKKEFDDLVAHAPIMSDKDRNGQSLGGWLSDERSKNFM
ncbi:MAG: dTDP-4-dehydrorhamnose 3,5-epimerase family protein [candidate division Zixibacteria bacterium]|nr:dTDP-4-dehydrorhamnose 3,5-epimerase family protein [candidate division Zixibacteria bacterium]